MPRLKSSVPKYALHKASGQASGRIDGVEHWLGQYGTAESSEKYHKLIERYLAGRRMRESGP